MSRIWIPSSPLSRFLQDVSRGGTLLLSSSIAGYLFFRSGQMLNLDFKWMTFVVIGAVSVALVGIFESVSLAYPYYSINQRLTHGSARWASVADLKAKGLAHPSRQPLPYGAVRIGRLSSALSPRQYDLILSLKQLLTHTGIFGPSDSGKSATFYMNILRDFSEWGSALVMDVKGELYCAHGTILRSCLSDRPGEPESLRSLEPAAPLFREWGTRTFHRLNPRWLRTREHEGQRQHSLLDLR